MSKKTALACILVSFFFSGQIIGQEINANLLLTDKIKTTETKEHIEKWLVGYWDFIEMKSPEGKHIDTLLHKVGEEIIGFEPITRTDYVFYSNMTYSSNVALSSNEEVHQDSTLGTWYYESKNKELKLNYHKPFYPEYPGISNQQKQKMIEQGILRMNYGTFLEIHYINENELVLVEHRAHDENELIYNLLYYKKRR